MKSLLKDFKKKDQKGIYQIRNVLTDQIYIGSVSSSTFWKRYKTHKRRLELKKHENAHLQHSVNKHGISNFVFEIREILCENILEREQELLDTLDFKSLYNINPFAAKPPCWSNATKEQKVKKQKAFQKFLDIASPYYHKVKTGELTFLEIPEQYRDYVRSRLEHVPWNKGKDSSVIDYSFLKGVPKTKTEAFMKARITMGETIRNRSKRVNVYNYKGDFIKSFRSPSDIVDYTKEEHDLPLILRSFNNRTSTKHGTSPFLEFGKGIPSKRKTPFFRLEINNILKVCKGFQKHHKGLIFRYEDSDLEVVPLKPQDLYWNKKSFNSCAFYNHSYAEEKSSDEYSVNSVEA